MKYTSLNDYLQRRFGCKVYKIALSGGMTCPNRDGTLGSRGCIFCSAGGSGDFAAPVELSVTEQIEFGKKLLEKKLFEGKPEDKRRRVKYIAYFQSFTNTYAPVERLRGLFTEAIGNPDIAVLSIATRPDCLGDDVIELLCELNRIKPVWVELGLQTVHPHTAELIRRGYEIPVFENAVERLNKAGIETIVHVILGLPGETQEMMLDTVRYLVNLGNADLQKKKSPDNDVGCFFEGCSVSGASEMKGIQGIKLQLLHVLSGTDLGEEYLQELKTISAEMKPEQSAMAAADKIGLHIKSFEDYADILLRCLDIIPKDIVVHRLTGDAPKRSLLFPKWSADKKLVLNRIRQLTE